MPAFSSTPLNEGSLNRTFRRNPALFGIPFVLLIVGASFAMTTFTQTKYDLQASRQASLAKEDELGHQRRKKKFDIREEYFRMEAKAEAEWEPKRIERPKGVPEWGVPPTAS